MRALVLIALLAACSQQTQTAETPATETAAPAEPLSTQGALAQMPQWDAARAAGVDFRGAGQEPGWMLDIYGEGQIVLLWNYGENLQRFPPTNITFPQEGAQRYEAQADGHTIAITIRRFPCEDAMSGEAYPSTVEVVIDGATLNGCGRSV